MDLNGAFQKRPAVTLNVTATSTTRQRKTRKRAYLPRRTRRFQLRNNHEQDIRVTEILDRARRGRREVTVIRDAVELYHSLENGDLSMLFEKFPQYKVLFDTTAALAQITENMQRTAIGQPADTKGQVGLKALPAPTIEMPVFDDEDTVLVSTVSKSAGSEAAANFLASMNVTVH